MKKDAFDFVCSKIRRAWDPCTGVVVKFKHSYSDKQELRLCVGSYRNSAIAARKCAVWEGDKLLYDGELLSTELRKLLTARRVCLAEFTTVSMMNR